MGILSSALYRNLKSRLKKCLPSSSFSSNPWLISSSPAGGGLSRREAQNPEESQKPTMEHVPPYNYYSLISLNSPWKDNYRSLSNPFSSSAIIGHDDSDYRYFIGGGCNELMLVFCESSEPEANDRREALWNPTTNEIKILDESTDYVPPPTPCPAPQIDILAHAFGYDPKSADYKLLRFAHFCDCDIHTSGHYQIELYSLKTNSWKNITSSYPFPLDEPPQQQHSVHINGVYYWLKKSVPGNIMTPFRYNIIVSFDFATEKFFSAPHIPTPPLFNGFHPTSVDDIVLVEFDGSLAALVHSGLRPGLEENIEHIFTFEKLFCLEVWGWNGSWWSKKTPRTYAPCCGDDVNMVGLFQDDKLFLQTHSAGELLLLDCATRELENLGISASSPRRLNNIYPYVQSSVPFTFTGK